MASYLRALLRKHNIPKRSIDKGINNATCPSEYVTEDFIELFLNHLTIVGDSREQNDWIERACNFYGINFEKAVKDKQTGTENLKEGDYTFYLTYGDTKFDYRGEVAYERKGSLSEIYNNLKSKDRERIEREFQRFIDKQYKKVVLVLEYGESMNDLINAEFNFINHDGKWDSRNVGKLVFTSLMAWKQPNSFNFEIYQNENHLKTFWYIILDMYYYFRNALKEVKEDAKESM